MGDAGEGDRRSARYLAELREQRAALDRFPRSARAQALILAVSLPIVAAGFFGYSILPVPGYVLVPFVVVPAWALVRHERAWQAETRSLTKLIRLVAGPGDEATGSAEGDE